MALLIDRGELSGSDAFEGLTGRPPEFVNL
jgi:hypothetical protein